MKKIIAIMLVAATTFAAVGCSTNKEKDTAVDASSSVVENKKYVIATDTTFAPFEFENEKGEMVGIDLDLLKAIAEDQGFEYELQILGFSAAVTSLEAGQCDAVIAGMSIRPDREKTYDFSEAYFQSGVGMGVLEDSEIATYEDLAGKKVAAKVGTDGCKFAEDNAEQYGYTVIQFEDSSSMYQDVLSGNSAACFEDYPVMGYEITRGMKLKMPLPMEYGSKYGFATLKGKQPELVEKFNAGLANLKESGKYDEIVNTYISQ